MDEPRVIDSSKKQDLKAHNKKVFFPKKSAGGYFDKTFQKKFYDEKHKRNFMNEHGFVETGRASEAHEKRVKDFSRWIKSEKSKNPNFEQTKEYKNQKYPD